MAEFVPDRKLKVMFKKWPHHYISKCMKNQNFLYVQYYL